MVGTDLATQAEETLAAAETAYPVVLHGGEAASGLADMLHQYLLQSVTDSPRRALQALEIQGEVLFGAAEDEEVCVRISFKGERIELSDAGIERPDGLPWMVTDFISVAHLTTGEEGPFGLLLRRKMRVRFSPTQVPFLVSVLRFMQIPPELMDEPPSRAAAWWVAGSLAAAGAGGALYWYLTATP